MPVRRRRLHALAKAGACVALLLACGGTSTRNGPGSGEASTPDSTGAGGDAGQGTGPTAGRADASGDGRAPPGSTSNVRVMAANISSGAASTYDSGEGIRIFQGLHPDVALVQELNYKTNSSEDLAEFVGLAFGADYTYFRESNAQIANAVVSRFPILASGQWVDPEVSNRSFAWAKIAVPGAHPLWAVAVHLLTSSALHRSAEATALVAALQAVVAEGDLVAIGGDFNTDARSEGCIQTLSAIVDSADAYPADQLGNAATNAPRAKPYDWVLVSPSLRANQVATVIGQSTFPTGLVFDSRVYTPLDEVAPIQKSDSGSLNMQHMPVVRDFLLPE